MMPPSLLRFSTAALCLALIGALPMAVAQDAGKDAVTKLEEAFEAIDKKASPARQRLAIRRIIRDAETALKEVGDKPERWPIFEFQFKAQQGLVSLEEDSKHRKALMKIGRELVKAPKEFAIHKVEADVLLSRRK